MDRAIVSLCHQKLTDSQKINKLFLRAVTLFMVHWVLSLPPFSVWRSAASLKVELLEVLRLGYWMKKTTYADILFESIKSPRFYESLKPIPHLAPFGIVGS
jgi:hypothetical protein